MNLEDIMRNKMSDTKGEILYGPPYIIGKFMETESRMMVPLGQRERG